VLLEITKVAEVGAAPADAWSLIRDVPRLSGWIPNVSDLEVVDEDRQYRAVVADKVGPFRVQVPVQIELLDVDAPRRIVASLVGNDRGNLARVRGTLEAAVEPVADEAGARLTLGVRLEVLGRLATLGAAPMRRRADEIFGEFARCLERELSAATPDERAIPRGGA
jgi:carbon monoxide dehydrogenase subunit G